MAIPFRVQGVVCFVRLLQALEWRYVERGREVPVDNEAKVTWPSLQHLFDLWIRGRGEEIDVRLDVFHHPW